MCSRNNNNSVVPVPSTSSLSLNHLKNMFHCFSCESIASVIKSRHDKISYAVHSFLIRFCNNTVSQTEEVFRCMLNGAQHKVDVISTDNGSTYYIDVSIFNCGCPSHARVHGDTS